MKKMTEKPRRYPPTKGNQEKTDRIINIIDIMDLIDNSSPIIFHRFPFIANI